MIPEAGAFELVFLAAVALIVVGPKDLPVLMRKVGEFTRKMRGLADEFRHSFDEMARQSELDDLRREVEALRDGGRDSRHTVDAEFTAIGDQLAAPARAAAYGDAEPELPVAEPRPRLVVPALESDAASPSEAEAVAAGPAAAAPAAEAEPERARQPQPTLAQAQAE